MNIFRGYTDGLASSYGVATYQSRTFARPKTPKTTSPKLVRRSVVKALQAVLQIVSKRRGGSSAPSDRALNISRVDQFLRPAAPQFS